MLLDYAPRKDNSVFGYTIYAKDLPERTKLPGLLRYEALSKE